MKLIDSHTHVQFPAYDTDREEVIKRAKSAGVKIITVGTQFSTSEAGIKLAEKYPKDIWATAGFHPNHFAEDWYHDKKEQKESEREKFDIKVLENLARNSKVVAIGEFGLDYFRLGNYAENFKKRQKEAFLAMAGLGEKLKKPLMLHVRPSAKTDDAYEDMHSLITNNQFSIPKIVHFYVGSLEMTKKLVEAGFYFTFGGVITFARNYDESIKYIPLDRILLETDAPYVAPAPYRGKRNEPAYVIEVAKKMAELKNVSLEKVAEITVANTKTVFGM